MGESTVSRIQELSGPGDQFGANEFPSCHGGLLNLDEEHSYWFSGSSVGGSQSMGSDPVLGEIEGQLPHDLRGTFFRNGPGRQRIGDSTYGHWFDGDGMLCAFEFGERGVHFKNRYVRTPKYIAETEAQAVKFRGFGTQLPGGLRGNFAKPTGNPANTNTIWHGDKLLALYEGGKPWALDPQSLATVGEFDYDGGLKRPEVFSAHGKVHQASGDYINFGAGVSGIGLKGLKPCLHLYRINPAGKLYRRSAVALDTFPFCHDFALTNKYAVFFMGSIVFGSILPVALGSKSISDQIGFDKTVPMQVLVIDLETLELVRRFETQPGAMIHFGNAYDQGDEIIVDGMYASDFAANDTLTDVFNPDGRFNGGTYKRYVLNLANGSMDAAEVCEVEAEFPTFNPRFTGVKNSVTYTACSIDNGANSFFNGIQSVTHDGDTLQVELPRGMYGSEPMFAPAVGATHERDGYLLEVVYNGWIHKSELQIFRADNVGDHLCTLKLPHHIPHQFHGHFTQAVFNT